MEAEIVAVIAEDMPAAMAVATVCSSRFGWPAPRVRGRLECRNGLVSWIYPAT